MKPRLFTLSNHRHSDAGIDSPPSERETPMNSIVQESIPVQCFKGSVKADFADMNHLRVSDGSNISRHPSDDDGGKQEVQIGQAKPTLIFDPHELDCSWFC